MRNAPEVSALINAANTLMCANVCCCVELRHPCARGSPKDGCDSGLGSVDIHLFLCSMQVRLCSGAGFLVETMRAILIISHVRISLQRYESQCDFF